MLIDEMSLEDLEAALALVRQWIAALRGEIKKPHAFWSDDGSRFYQKHKGSLRSRRGGMCCFGVLATLIDPARWKLVNRIRWVWGGRLADIGEEALRTVGLDPSDQSLLIHLNDEWSDWARVIDRLVQHENTLASRVEVIKEGGTP